MLKVSSKCNTTHQLTTWFWWAICSGSTFFRSWIRRASFKFQVFQVSSIKSWILISIILRGVCRIWMRCCSGKFLEANMNSCGETCYRLRTESIWILDNIVTWSGCKAAECINSARTSLSIWAKTSTLKKGKSSSSSSKVSKTSFKAGSSNSF